MPPTTRTRSKGLKNYRVPTLILPDILKITRVKADRMIKRKRKKSEIKEEPFEQLVQELEKRAENNKEGSSAKSSNQQNKSKAQLNPANQAKNQKMQINISTSSLNNELLDQRLKTEKPICEVADKFEDPVLDPAQAAARSSKGTASRSIKDEGSSKVVASLSQASPRSTKVAMRSLSFASSSNAAESTQQVIENLIQALVFQSQALVNSSQAFACVSQTFTQIATSKVLNSVKALSNALESSSEAGARCSSQLSTDQSKIPSCSPMEEVNILKGKLLVERNNSWQLRREINSLQRQLEKKSKESFDLNRNVLDLMTTEEMDVVQDVNAAPTWSAVEIAKAAANVHYAKHCYSYFRKVLQSQGPTLKEVLSDLQTENLKQEIVIKMKEIMSQNDQNAGPSEQEVENILDALFQENI